MSQPQPLLQRQPSVDNVSSTEVKEEAASGVDDGTLDYRRVNYPPPNPSPRPDWGLNDSGSQAIDIIYYGVEIKLDSGGEIEKEVISLEDSIKGLALAPHSAILATARSQPGKSTDTVQPGTVAVKPAAQSLLRPNWSIAVYDYTSTALHGTISAATGFEVKVPHCRNILLVLQLIDAQGYLPTQRLHDLYYSVDSEVVLEDPCPPPYISSIHPLFDSLPEEYKDNINSYMPVHVHGLVAPPTNVENNPWLEIPIVPSKRRNAARSILKLKIAVDRRQPGPAKKSILKKPVEFSTSKEVESRLAGPIITEAISLRVDFFRMMGRDRKFKQGLDSSKTVTYNITLPAPNTTRKSSVKSSEALLIQEAMIESVEPCWAIRITLMSPNPAALVLRGLDLTWADVDGCTILDDLANAFELYKDLRCFGRRRLISEEEAKQFDVLQGPNKEAASNGFVAGPFNWITYGEAQDLGRAISAGFEDVLPKALEFRAKAAIQAARPWKPLTGASSTTEQRIFAGIMARNCAEWVLFELACLHTCGVPVPMMPAAPESHIRHILGQTEAVALLVEPASIQRVLNSAPELPSLSLIVVLDTDNGKPAMPQLEGAEGDFAENGLQFLGSDTSEGSAPIAGDTGSGLVVLRMSSLIRHGKSILARGLAAANVENSSFASVWQTAPAQLLHTTRWPLPPKSLWLQSQSQSSNTLQPLSWAAAVRSRVLTLEAGSRKRRFGVPKAVWVDSMTGAKVEDLGLVMYTSGSTGNPKGVMETIEGLRRTWHEYWPSTTPGVHASIQPLAHASEHSTMVPVLLNGGRAGFRTSPQHDIYSDVRVLAPSEVGSVPAFFNALYAQYQKSLLFAMAYSTDRTPEEAKASLKEAFAQSLGPRVQVLSVGSAPVSPAVLKWMREIWDHCYVSEGYGSTEAGTMSVDNKISSKVTLKLRSVPELGYDANGTPPRGEVVVMPSKPFRGYFNDTAATKEVLQEDGSVRTGDIGELQPDGSLVIIGRLKHVTKLANGEFVAPERIEQIMLESKFIDQLYVCAKGTEYGVVAVVVPNKESLALQLKSSGRRFASDADMFCSPEAHSLLLDDMKRLAAVHTLQPYETPSAVAIETRWRFSAASGLMTGSNKPDRKALGRAYDTVVAALYANRSPYPHMTATSPRDDATSGPSGDIESKGTAEEMKEDSSTLSALAQKASSIAAHLIGTSSQGSMNEELFFTIASNSLSTKQLMSRLSREAGLDIPMHLFYEAVNLKDLAEKIEAWKTGKSPKPSDAGGSSSIELNNVQLFQQDVAAWKREWLGGGEPATATTTPVAPLVVLLTGATGFLGVHLLQSLVARANDEEGPHAGMKVHCIVRVRPSDVVKEIRGNAAEMPISPWEGPSHPTSTMASGGSTATAPRRPPLLRSQSSVTREYVEGSRGSKGMTAHEMKEDASATRSLGLKAWGANSTEIDEAAYTLARERLVKAVEETGQRWTAAFEKTVAAVPGDLSETHFGWCPELYGKQADVVDLVLHAGAVVNWVLPYSALRKANVVGSQEVLHFATAGRKVKQVHFVSSISTTSAGDETSFDDRATVESAVQVSGGYAASKWVSEYYMRQSQQCGFPVAIYRPGMITGHSKTGHAHPQQFVYRYLRGCVELGCGLGADLPADAEQELHPVDHVSESVVALMLKGQSSLGQTFHLINSRSPKVVELTKFIRNYGYDCDLVSYEEFRKRLASASKESATALAPLADMFAPQAKDWLFRPHPYTDPLTRPALESCGLWPPPIASESLIHTYLNAMHLRGHLEPPRKLQLLVNSALPAALGQPTAEEAAGPAPAPIAASEPTPTPPKAQKRIARRSKPRAKEQTQREEKMLARNQWFMEGAKAMLKDDPSCDLSVLFEDYSQLVEH